MAEEVLTLGAVRDAVQQEYRRRHDALQAEYEALGLERQRIVTTDGMDFGSVVYTTGSVTVEITDTEAMIDYMSHEHPDELVTKTVYSINAAYWRLLANAAKKAGVGVDPHTGQVLDWIKVSISDRNLRATPTRAAKTQVRDLLNNSGLRLELEAD